MSNYTTDATFEKDVLQSDVPVLVDFWAPWCGPCQMLGPIIEGLGQKMEGKAKVLKLNVDENPETARKFGIRSIPTVMVFKNGKPEHQLVGLRPEGEYRLALGV